MQIFIGKMPKNPCASCCEFSPLEICSLLEHCVERTEYLGQQSILSQMVEVDELLFDNEWVKFKFHTDKDKKSFEDYLKQQLGEV